MRYPSIWSNIFLGVTVRVFLDAINIWISRLTKQVTLPDMGGPHLISWRLKHQLSLLAFRLNHITGCPGSLACCWQILGFVLWGTLTNTVSSVALPSWITVPELPIHNKCVLCPDTEACLLDPCPSLYVPLVLLNANTWLHPEWLPFSTFSRSCLAST